MIWILVVNTLITAGYLISYFCFTISEKSYGSKFVVYRNVYYALGIGAGITSFVIGFVSLGMIIWRLW